MQGRPRGPRRDRERPPTVRRPPSGTDGRERTRAATRRRTRDRNRGRDRGQAHTLEAITASFVLLSALVFALQATAVTPLSASTASQHIENQQRSVARGVLAVTDETGALKRSVLFWDTSNDKFHSATNSYYVNSAPPNDFGDVLDRAYQGRGIVYNVYVVYENANGNWVKRRMVYRGEPSDHAVSASQTVTLYDDDVIYDASESPSGTNISETSDFYATDVSSGTDLYNLVRVEVVVWRM